MKKHDVPDDNADDDVSIQQAAVRKDVSEKTIRRRIADGSLPAHRYGTRLIRIRRADLDAPSRPLR